MVAIHGSVRENTLDSEESNQEIVELPEFFLTLEKIRALFFIFKKNIQRTID
jgi:hypothetical protein